MLDDGGRCLAGVQNRSLKWVTCTRCRSGRSASGCRVSGTLVGGVVLDIDGGQVRARCAPGELRGEALLGRPLQDDGVDLLVAEPGEGHLHGGPGPVPRPCPAPAVRAAAGRQRQQAGVPTLNECRRPRAMDVPDQQPHWRSSAWAAVRAPRAVSWSSASHAATALTTVRQGCPGTGQCTARLPRQGARWSPSRATGTHTETAGGRDDRREQRHDGGLDRRGEVSHTGVGHHDGVCPGYDRSEFGQAGPAAQVDDLGAAAVARLPGGCRGQFPLVGAAGQHEPAGPGRPVRRRPRPSDGLASGAREPMRPVQHHVRPGPGEPRHVGQREPHGQPAVVTGRQAEACGAGQRQRPLGFRDAVIAAVPEVEQRSRVVLADGGDPGNARQPEHQGGGQRGLVEDCGESPRR